MIGKKGENASRVERGEQATCCVANWTDVVRAAALKCVKQESWGGGECQIRGE